MTYDPDKIEALIKAVDALENPKSRFDESLEIDAVIAARRALDPPKPEAPERLWVNCYDPDRNVPDDVVAHLSEDSARNGLCPGVTNAAVEYIRSDLTARPVKGGVSGWMRIYKDGVMGKQLWSLHEDAFPSNANVARVIFLRECEPE